MNAVAIDLSARIYNFRKRMGDLTNKYDYRHIIDYFNVCKNRDNKKNIVDMFFELFPIFKDYGIDEMNDDCLWIKKDDGSINGHFEKGSSSLSLFINYGPAKKVLKEYILPEDSSDERLLEGFDLITKGLNFRGHVYCEAINHEFGRPIFETIYEIGNKEKYYYDIIPISKDQVMLFLTNKHQLEENKGEVCNHVDLGPLY